MAVKGAECFPMEALVMGLSRCVIQKFFFPSFHNICLRCFSFSMSVFYLQEIFFLFLLLLLFLYEGAVQCTQKTIGLSLTLSAVGTKWLYKIVRLLMYQKYLELVVPTRLMFKSINSHVLYRWLRSTVLEVLLKFKRTRTGQLILKKWFH